MNNEYKLTLKGFKTKEQVKAFIDWYAGQGEQDASYWFGARMDDGEIDIDNMPIDVTKPYEWHENTLVAFLKI